MIIFLNKETFCLRSTQKKIVVELEKKPTVPISMSSLRVETVKMSSNSNVHFFLLLLLNSFLLISFDRLNATVFLSDLLLRKC